MSETPVAEPASAAEPNGPGAPVGVASRRPSRLMLAGAAVALVAIGAVAGSLAGGGSGYRDAEFLMKPTAVNALKDDTTVAISGKVAEIYGNKFIIADATGRALVDAGRRGEGGGLVKPGEDLIVQGHFDRGFIHGEILKHADGSAESLRPPHPGPRGWAERLHGPRVDVAGEPG